MLLFACRAISIKVMRLHGHAGHRSAGMSEDEICVRVRWNTNNCIVDVATARACSMQCPEGELSYCSWTLPQRGVGTEATLLPRKCCCCAAVCQCAVHLEVVSGAYQVRILSNAVCNESPRIACRLLPCGASLPALQRDHCAIVTDVPQLGTSF